MSILKMTKSDKSHETSYISFFLQKTKYSFELIYSLQENSPY